jgi:predicted membrane channel-forming protein YqfA (hemolysin III family)
MRTQIKIIGTIDLLLGIFFFWAFWDFMFQSTTNFIQNEFTPTIFSVGLIIGGVGLWSRKKIGWIANQWTGIHIILSVLIQITLTSHGLAKADNAATTFIFLVVLVLIIGARLFWTNRQRWLDEFELSNKLRVITITIATIISLVLLLKSYV